MIAIAAMGAAGVGLVFAGFALWSHDGPVARVMTAASSPMWGQLQLCL